MNEKTWIRVAGAAGILSVVLWWTGAFADHANGDPDPASATQEEIAGFMSEHAASDPARLAFALSAFLTVWLVAGLYTRMLRAQLDPTLAAVAIGSGIVAATLMLAGSAGWLAAGFPAVRDLGQDETVLAYALQLAPGLSASIGFAGLLLAVGIASITRRVLPRWLGWSGLLIAVGELAGYLDPLESPLSGSSMMLRMLWIVVVGVVLVARPVSPGVHRPEPAKV